MSKLDKTLEEEIFGDRGTHDCRGIIKLLELVAPEPDEKTALAAKLRKAAPNITKASLWLEDQTYLAADDIGRKIAEQADPSLGDKPGSISKRFKQAGRAMKQLGHMAMNPHETHSAYDLVHTAAGGWLTTSEQRKEASRRAKAGLPSVEEEAQIAKEEAIDAAFKGLSPDHQFLCRMLALADQDMDRRLMSMLLVNLRNQYSTDHPQEYKEAAGLHHKDDYSTLAMVNILEDCASRCGKTGKLKDDLTKMLTTVASDLDEWYAAMQSALKRLASPKTSSAASDTPDTKVLRGPTVAGGPKLTENGIELP